MNDAILVCATYAHHLGDLIFAYAGGFFTAGIASIWWFEIRKRS